MGLPVEQYSTVLGRDMIQSKGGGRFVLAVPRMQIFDIWLEPEVEVTVETGNGVVRLVAEECRLNGSPQVQRLNLDDRYAMLWRTTLSWEDGTASRSGAISAETKVTMQGCWRALFRFDCHAGDCPLPLSLHCHRFPCAILALIVLPALPSFFCAILALIVLHALPSFFCVILSLCHCSPDPSSLSTRCTALPHTASQLDVWCEVVPPFNLMPRELLQSSCNTVLSATSSMLLPLFLRRLAADYQRWATDPQYRETRAQLGEPLQLPS